MSGAEGRGGVMVEGEEWGEVGRGRKEGVGDGRKRVMTGNRKRREGGEGGGEVGWRKGEVGG